MGYHEPTQHIARTLPGEPAHWRTACMPLGQPAHRTALARLPFSQGQVAVRTTPPIAIKTKTHGVTLGMAVFPMGMGTRGYPTLK